MLTRRELTTREFTRREFAKRGLKWLVATPGIVTLLEACASASPSASTAIASQAASAGATSMVGPEAGGGTLAAAWWGGDHRAEITQQVMDLFKEKYPDWAFEPTFTDFFSHWDKLNTQAAGGSLPDIIQMDMRYIKQFADRNQVLPLDPFEMAELNMGDFDPGQRQQGTVDGKLYVISAGGNIQSLLYNATLLGDIGIDAPTEMSWDQFADFGTQVQSKLPSGMYALDDTSFDISIFEVFARERTKRELYTADGQLDFTEEDAKAWFDLWQGWRDAGFITTGEMAAAHQQQETPDNEPVVLGKTAMRLQWSNFVGQYVALMQDTDVALAVHPGGAKDGTYVKIAVGWSIAVDTEFPHAATAFLGFMLTDPDAVAVLGLDRGVPPSAGARASLAPNLTPADKVQLDFVNAQVDNSRGKTVLDPPGAGEVQKSLARNALSIPLTGVSTSDAAATFLEESQTALNA
jgi:multiple sugar transport system substrate-binding protein